MKVSSDVILRQVAGEYVLVPTGKAASKLYGLMTLNESGVMLWHKMQNECTEEELVDLLMAEYDVDSATATLDVRRFLAKLSEVGIIE